MILGVSPPGSAVVLSMARMAGFMGRPGQLACACCAAHDFDLCGPHRQVTLLSAWFVMATLALLQASKPTGALHAGTHRGFMPAHWVACLSRALWGRLSSALLHQTPTS